MADEGVVRADGHNGQVEFDGRTVVVSREGARGRMTHGSQERSVSLANIQRVDFEEPSIRYKGYIRFAVPGEIENDVVNDAYCVLFTRKQTADFIGLRDAVKSTLAARTEAERDELRARASAAARESRDAQRDVERASAEASYAGHVARGDVYIYARPDSSTAFKTVAGAVASFESGADRSRPTLTRIGAGAIIAGPAGAIVGGLFKKDTSKCYVTVVFADGDTAIVEGPVKDEKKLRQFAADVNRIAAL
ncbi:DUF4429 domain-containing protein [Leucobacter muris]|uniref:DUF4429 domain-containing protein n=1 Tax=Leucobacter muris TaxID=1935379 RepID=A0ABX5QEJ0_9MICO|nr:DUF4429 domain-containing protein [Leucobacter muris]QAB17489.1 DUF4429 domain-containing protein [Leucobacter muris]